MGRAHEGSGCGVQRAAREQVAGIPVVRHDYLQLRLNTRTAGDGGERQLGLAVQDRGAEASRRTGHAKVERDVVLRAIYGMAERDFNRHFLQARFTGEVLAAPKLLSTARGVKKFVLNVPGAIAYIRFDELDDSVKPIHIDNQAPADPGYKLRVLLP